ncbi:hypothetical protein [Paenibacillus sp. PL2-23]|uniref:hypothetical protein n=1 Tax=Paenibacillus sp. PL2-23 TaxID=2100729 RepID=UPI0030F89549
MMDKTKKVIGSSSLILILCFFIFFTFGNPLKYYTLKGDFKKFLEDKYDQKFVVGNISFDIMHRTYHSNATTVNEPKIRFYVGQNNITKEINDAYDYEKKEISGRKIRISFPYRRRRGDTSQSGSIAKRLLPY